MSHPGTRISFDKDFHLGPALSTSWSIVTSNCTIWWLCLAWNYWLRKRHLKSVLKGCYSSAVSLIRGLFVKERQLHCSCVSIGDWVVTWVITYCTNVKLFLCYKISQSRIKGHKNEPFILKYDYKWITWVMSNMKSEQKLELLLFDGDRWFPAGTEVITQLLLSVVN